MAVLLLKKVGKSWFIIEPVSGKYSELVDTMAVWNIFHDSMHDHGKYLIVCDFEFLPLESLVYTLKNYNSESGLLIARDIDIDGENLSYQFLFTQYASIDGLIETIKKNNHVFMKSFDENNCVQTIDSFSKMYYFSVLKFFLMLGFRDLKIEDSRINLDPSLIKEIIFEYNYIQENKIEENIEIDNYFLEKYNLDFSKIKNVVSFFRDLDLNLSGESVVKIKSNPFFSGTNDINVMFFKNLFNYDDFNLTNQRAFNNLFNFGSDRFIDVER